MLRNIYIFFSCIALFTGNCMAQELQAVNRSLVHGSIIHLNEAPGAGIAWIKNKQFTTGTIEFDARGKDLLQQSFVGFAFHGLNDSTYDAVYFRPFNFRAPEAGRRGHAVQYISLPSNDWAVLRQQHPGKYENEITPPPDPNKWFHVKMVVTDQEITVFVNGNKCLTVTKLSAQKTGKIGYWVGNGSAGDWKNLNIKQAR